jgi:hypothetical protein
MQKTDEYIRPRGYFDNKGNKLNVNFDTVNMALSGITASATQLNMLASGFISSALYAVSANYAASASYAASAGTLSGVTATASQLNNILYGLALFKYAIASTLVSNGMTMSHGLTSALYCVVTPQTGGVIAGGRVSGTSITFYIQANAGIFFETTSATVDWIAFGN